MKIMTTGWTNTQPHTCNLHVDGVDDDLVAIFDICPVCNEIGGGRIYQGDSSPSMIGLYRAVQQTHRSLCHGSVPEGDPVTPEILEYAKPLIKTAAVNAREKMLQYAIWGKEGEPRMMRVPDVGILLAREHRMEEFMREYPEAVEVRR